MKFKCRRLFAVMLAFCMTLGMMSNVTVFAAEEGDPELSESIDIEIPVVKHVNNTKSVESFEFDFSIDNEVDMTVKNGTVEVTGGATDYHSTFVISVPKDQLEVMADSTLTITEKNKGVRGWTYDSNEVTVTFGYSEDMVFGVDSIHNSNYSVLEDIAYFSNGYMIYDLIVPFITTVDVNGTGTVPAKDFDYTAYELTDFSDDTAVIDDVLQTATVETDGAGTYNGAMEFSFTPEELGDMKAILITAENDGESGWLYAPFSYVAVITPYVVNDLDTETLSGYGISYYMAYVSGETVTIGGETSKEHLIFPYEYTPLTNIKIEIPFTKEVKLGGAAEPGKTDFEFELITFADADMKVEGNVVTTNGKGVYEGKLIITVAEEDLMNLTEGMVLVEKAVSDTKWTCDDTAWFIGLYPIEVNSFDEDRTAVDISSFDMAFYKAEKVESDGETFYNPTNESAEKITFVNTYTHTEVVAPEPIEPTQPGTPATPATGDTTNVILWMSILLVSGLGVSVTLFARKRRA